MCALKHLPRKECEVKMKKIVLLCNMGLSTSALVRKMKNHAKEIGYECTIVAFPVKKAIEVAIDADCVLLGPQVAFQLSMVREMLPHIPVNVITMQAYGMIDGKQVIEQVIALLGENNV